MKAQGKDAAPMHDLTASVVATPVTGSVAAALSLRTPDPALLLAGVAVFGVVAVVGFGAVMLTWGPARQQRAELALPDDDIGGLSPDQLEPYA